MGEKKMLQKERKSPSQKKEKKVIAPISSWCPSLGSIWRGRLGGNTKSWISSSPSSCCIHQTWPQLVVVFSPDEDKDYYSREIEKIIPFLRTAGDREMAITGVSSPAFVFHSYKRDPKGSWYARNCRVTEPFSGENHRYMEFTNLIEFERKYYVISRQGCLALIEDEGNSGNFEITALGRNRVVPHCKESRHFREYMFEYNGEIYLVFLLSRASIKTVDGVEVYRLERSRLSLEKVDRLKGDVMFFLQDNRCFGISASKLGCSKGSNCIYFTHGRANGTWFVYNMETSCISPTLGPERDR